MRSEAFGGLAFQRATGLLLEVDHEAFTLLELLRDSTLGIPALSTAVRSVSGRRFAVSEVASIVQAFVTRGIIVEVAEPGNDSVETAKRSDVSAPHGDLSPSSLTLSSPITVHWAITYRCGLACPYCYALRPKTRRELSREEKLRVVDRLAAWGVLEVALGGGEPTAEPDLDHVLPAVRGTGMVPNVTTNGQNVTPTLAKLFAETCGCVQVSLDRPEILDRYRGTGVAATALAAAERLQDADVLVGANLLLVPENIENIERSLGFLERQGIKRVVLLRPFGTCGGLWPRPWPTAAGWAGLRQSLHKWAAGNPAVSLEVACGLSFLLDDLPRDSSRAELTSSCPGGRRFAALGSDGTLFPCSHLSSPGFRLGHIMDDDPPTMWRHAQSLLGQRLANEHTSCLAD